MMLALLVMGVSNVWAVDDEGNYHYRVFFESGVIKGGYTVKANQSVVISGNDAYELVSTDRLREDSWRTNYWGNFIELRTVTGNTASVSISTNDNAKQMGFDGIIYINYNSDAAEVTTSDGVFIYSNIYQRDTYDRIQLPNDQYAISLNPDYLSSNVNVTIPKTYNGKRVTAIQKWGFCEDEPSTSKSLTSCYYNRTNSQYHDYPDDRSSHYYSGSGTVSSRTNSHSNQYLKTVTFENASNLLSIGDYAFMSCTELVSIDIPSSVEYLGQGLFEQDEKLKDVNFQTTSITRDGKTFSGVKFNTIRDYTFWLCTGIETLILPDGIEYIEGQTGGDSSGEAEGGGAPLQYMTSLINIRLPNTLLRVGPHFLCSCKALRTVTIPVSVVYLDGACFHGCESLESVYILGPAATLKASQGSGSNTFGQNYTTCADPVNNCTFYTTTDNLESYQNDAVWSKINNNGNWQTSESGYTKGWGNYLVAMGENRIIPDYWVTALFPYGVADVTASFGAGTLVAEMDRCTGVSYQTIESTGKTYGVYHLSFRLLSGNTIPRHKPVLIKAGDKNKPTFQFFVGQEGAQAGKDQQGTDEFKTNSSVVFSESVNYSGATINMKGQYFQHLLAPGDFYFTYREAQKDAAGNITVPGDAKFYVVEEQSAAPMIKGCRCWWDIEETGMKQKNVSAKPASARFFDETTGIDDIETKVVIDAIYDLNGHKLNVKPEELPQGMFIINGKKVVKK